MLEHVCARLNKLGQLEIDAACAYREAVLHVDDSVLRAELHEFCANHERHASAIAVLVRDLGGTPIAARRDLVGMLLQGMTRLRSRSTLGALRALRMVEKLASRAYDKAATVTMPPLAEGLVMQHLAEERHHLAALEAHIERLTGQRYYDVDRIDREASELYPPY